MNMKQLLLLGLLLTLEGQRSSACPDICSCRGTQLDCSGRGLTSSSLPTTIPAGTTELLLHNNMLTALPRGLLDDLPSMHSVTLYGNPWVCDDGILYLRDWLQRQDPRLKSHLGVNCSSPLHLRGRLLVFITEEELLNSIYYWYCDLAFACQVCLFVLTVVQGLLLVALVIFLNKFEKLSKEAKRVTEESFTPHESQREYEGHALIDSSI